MIASSYTGIALALLSATSYNVGLIQEKRALGRMPALDLRRVLHVIASLLADPAWLAGKVRLPVLAFWAMVVSGLLAAVRPFGTGLFGPFGGPAQACALVALGAALIAGSVGGVGGRGHAEARGTGEAPGASGPSGLSELSGLSGPSGLSEEDR